MKVIFLDCDGVVCTARSHVVLGLATHGDKIWERWDPIACEALRLSCARGVSLVISSSWRHEDTDLLFQRLRESGLYEYVYKPDDPAEWATPDLSDTWQDVCRGNEITLWLKAHPTVTDYRIIDDCEDFLETQKKKIIHTDPDNGMSFENIRSLFRWVGILKS